jgi:hypothetical protein
MLKKPILKPTSIYGYTEREVRHKLGISSGEIIRSTLRGHLTGVTVGGTRYFPPQAVEEFEQYRRNRTEDEREADERGYDPTQHSSFESWSRKREEAASAEVKKREEAERKHRVHEVAAPKSATSELENKLNRLIALHEAANQPPPKTLAQMTTEEKVQFIREHGLGAWNDFLRAQSPPST